MTALDLLYVRESLEQVRSSRLEELLRAHWQEVAHFPDIALEPNWDAYELAESQGKLRVFTARAAGELIGYAAYFVGRNPHYRSSVQASQDVLFLARDRRGSHVGCRLIAFADNCLAAEGVQAVYQHSKVAHPMDSLLKRLGYQLVDTLWAKRLDRRD